MRTSFMDGMKRLAVIMLLFASVGACSGGGGASAPPAPVVTGVSFDSDTAGVFLNSSVAVVFSEVVDPTTITTTTFTVATTGGAPIAGRVNTLGANAVFVPSAPLQTGTGYRVTVTSGVRNLAGTPLVPFSSDFTTGATMDTTAPLVVATTPVNGASGVPGTAVSATFSKKMDPTTINSVTITLTGPNGAVAGSVSYGGVTAVFTPQPLLAGVTYTATISTGVKDLAGNALAAPVSFSFITQEQVIVAVPRVVSVSPADNATAVAVSSPVAVTFSKPMKPATVTATTFTLTSPSGPVAGAVTLDGTGTIATFTPLTSLATDTLYSASVSTGMTDTTGLSLGSPFTWSFTTALAPLSVLSTLPAAGATGVATNASITVTFSRAVNLTSVTTGSTFTLAGPSGQIPGTVVPNGAVATFTPTAALAPLTTFTATVTTGVTDLALNHLATPFSWNFTTGTGVDTTPPTVVGTTPVNGTVGVSLTAPGITATFSEAMDPQTVSQFTFLLSFSGAIMPGNVTMNGNVAQFTPSGALQANTPFTATITSGAKDLAGNPLLPAAFIWNFTTGL